MLIVTLHVKRLCYVIDAKDDYCTKMNTGEMET